MRRFLVALASLLLACSAAPTPPEAPATAGTAPDAAAAAQPGTASASQPDAASAPQPAAAAAEPPSARVTAVEPSKESVPYTRAKIELTNPGPKPCRILSYTLSWGAASKEIKLEDLTISPAQTRERWIKVHPNDGDLKALTVEGARVALKTDCGG